MLVLMLVFIMLSGCSSEKMPSEGVWYCEELNMSIDFGILQKTNKCVKLYNEDGTYEVLIMNIGFDDSIIIETDNLEVLCLADKYLYSIDNQTFEIINSLDQNTYTFTPTTNPELIKGPLPSTIDAKYGGFIIKQNINTKPVSYYMEVTYDIMDPIENCLLNYYEDGEGCCYAIGLSGTDKREEYNERYLLLDEYPDTIYFTKLNVIMDEFKQSTRLRDFSKDEIEIFIEMLVSDTLYE